MELPEPVRVAEGELELDEDLYVVPNSSEEPDYMEMAVLSSDRVDEKRADRAIAMKEGVKKTTTGEEAMGMEEGLWYKTATKTVVENTVIQWQKYESVERLAAEEAGMNKKEEGWWYKTTTTTQEEHTMVLGQQKE